MATVTAKKGDTLASISKKAFIPLEDLRASNKGIETVKPGQVISVPRPPRDEGYDGFQTPTSSAALTPTVTPSFAGNATNTNGGKRSPAGARGVASNNTVTEFFNVLSSLIPSFRPGNDIEASGRRSRNRDDQDSGGRGRSRSVPIRREEPFSGYTGTAGYWGMYNAAPLPFSNPNPGFTGQSTGFTGNPTNPYSYPANAGTAGYWGAYNQPNVGAGGQLSPDKNPLIQQPFLGSANYLDPAWQAQAQQNEATLKNIRPANADGSTPVFTGDPDDPNTKKWRDYWNEIAQMGGDPNIPPAAPTVMTREQIWEMKAAQRRAAAAQLSPEDVYGGGYEPYQYSADAQSYAPESLVRSITWGI